MSWEIKYLPEARKDLHKLDGSQLLLVRKAIKKVSQNPLPKQEGGYGTPLGNKNGQNLTGLLKIKLLKLGIRVVYKPIRVNNTMLMVVISARSDGEVYKIANERSKKNSLRD